MINLKRSPEAYEFNYKNGLFKKESKFGDVDFVDLYKQYNANRKLSMKKIAAATGIKQTMIFDKFSLITEEELYLL